MKRILIATHFFYPEITPRAFRATELANELSKRGYKVDVLIGSSQKIVEDYTSEKCDEMKDSFVLDKGNKKKPSKIKLLASKFIVSFFGETNVVKKKSLFLDLLEISKYDVIISIGPPFYTHYHISKLINKTEWIGKSITDWGDPFYRSGDAAFMFPHMRFVQKRVLNTFNFTTIPVEEAVSYYKQFTEDEKIKIIPQGFNFDVKIDENMKKNVEKSMNSINRPLFIYAGAFYKDVRDPQKILEYLCTVKEDFVFFIFSDMSGDIYEEILIPFKRKLKDKLVLMKKVPREELIEYLKMSDFVLNIENKSENQVPSKLIDLSLSGKPILSVNPHFLDENKFNDFLKGDYTKSLELDLSKYDIKNVTNQFIELIEGE
ncbi:hypothetical protein [Vagococcus carniphilus]|uniref:hypothetical protein n=1 Tax=Vagococcus carniphilus TaxID=218144 RepID=UPI003BA9000F